MNVISAFLSILPIAGFMMFPGSPTPPKAQADVPQGRRIWVMKAPDEITGYDAADFSVFRSVRIPPAAIGSPARFSINHAGRMLFVPNPDQESADSADKMSGNRIWFFDGKTSAWIERGIVHRRESAGSNRITVDIIPECFLAADGTVLFWFANEFRKVMDDTGNMERSVNTTMRVWRTDPAGGQRTEIAAFTFPPCTCGTGVCEETCPEAVFWPPETGVSDWFFVSHWIPGQLGPTYQEAYLYRTNGKAWAPIRLPHPLELLLDSRSQGTSYMEALLDAGCCGWDNESVDRTLLSRNGRSTVLFDEAERFENRDYDVSFLTSYARFSPDGSRAAMTVSATARPGSELRLSSEGKENAGELERIQRELQDLPMVEVLQTAQPPERIASLRNATLAGWLSDEEILILENGRLVAWNVIRQSRKATPIMVADARLVFVR